MQTACKTMSSTFLQPFISQGEAKAGNPVNHGLFPATSSRSFTTRSTLHIFIGFAGSTQRFCDTAGISKINIQNLSSQGEGLIPYPVWWWGSDYIIGWLGL
eukprot:407685_1